MIDPLLSLAFTMHANKGVYGLLVGSGVSRTAGIPTGWEIVLDLIRKLAHLEDMDCGVDPAAWYATTHGVEPDYAKILNAVAKRPAERSQLLRAYFEPSEDERAQGLKSPTEAHRAIAELVAAGHIRVIVTTNFDRLIETAIGQTGVVPSVIATADAVEGALPMTHSRCVVVKVNGDYLDMRIRNTEAELARYDRRLNRLLGRIFDEFGLVVCGWSGDWDIALRGAIERCRSRRFMTYWCTRGPVGDHAATVITHRRAETVRIESADQFFRALAEKVTALEEFSRPHPLSIAAAVTNVKSYLAEDRHRIRLGDQFREETERLYQVLGDEEIFPLQGPEPTQETFRERVYRYEEVSRVLQAMIATVCYWGEQGHEHVLRECLRRIATLRDGVPGLADWLSLRRYPSMLLAYAGGMAALARKRYGVLKTLLMDVTVRGFDAERPLALLVHPGGIMNRDLAQGLNELEKPRKVPISDYLAGRLRCAVRDFLPEDRDYERTFDRLEYLWAMIYVDLTDKGWAPSGSFIWRREAIEDIEREMAADGAEWGPLKIGLFSATLTRATEVKKRVDEHMERIRWM